MTRGEADQVHEAGLRCHAALDLEVHHAARDLRARWRHAHGIPRRRRRGDRIAVLITVDGVEIAQFSDLIDITSEATPPDLTGRILTKLPGRSKPPTVTLSRGMTQDLGVSAWHQSVVEGQPATARRNAGLVMYDTAGKPVARYHLENAWPSVLTVTSLKAGASEVLMETVTLVCDRLDRVALSERSLRLSHVEPAAVGPCRCGGRVAPGLLWFIRRVPVSPRRG